MECRGCTQRYKACRTALQAAKGALTQCEPMASRHFVTQVQGPGAG